MSVRLGWAIFDDGWRGGGEEGGFVDEGFGALCYGGKGVL